MVAELPDDLAQLTPGDLVEVRGEDHDFAFWAATHDPRMTTRLDGSPASGWSITVTYATDPKGVGSMRGWRSFYAEDVAPKLPPKPEPARHDLPSNVCVHCEQQFPHTGKRGRQPQRCPSCR